MEASLADTAAAAALARSAAAAPMVDIRTPASTGLRAGALLPLVACGLRRSLPARVPFNAAAAEGATPSMWGASASTAAACSALPGNPGRPAALGLAEASPASAPPPSVALGTGLGMAFALPVVATSTPRAFCSTWAGGGPSGCFGTLALALPMAELLGRMVDATTAAAAFATSASEGPPFEGRALGTGERIRGRFARLSARTRAPRARRRRWPSILTPKASKRQGSTHFRMLSGWDSRRSLGRTATAIWLKLWNSLFRAAP
mmetsp:Transcript_99683/g.279186  ORF Transcript_99683/g.279186 Transcript_99683/m.279186 type:complete len:262 (+) Transcript_99683:444-1229(+)